MSFKPTAIINTANDLREHTVKAVAEIKQLIERHPILARKLFNAGLSVFNELFASSTYRKFWEFYQLWKYSDEQKYYEVDEFGMDQSVLKVVEPLFQFLYFQYFRVEVEGAENIAVKGPGLIVANHSGTVAIYDGSIVNLAVMNNHADRRYARYLVDDFIYFLPFIGTFIQRTGGIRACHENAMRLLDHGHLVLVFPEGIEGVGKTYEERYRLKRFGRAGYVKLAMRTGVPIVPTAIIGAEEIHPIIWKSKRLGKYIGFPYFPFTPTFPWLGPLGLIPLPTKWRIIFGKPISFGKYSPSDADNFKLVSKISDSIKGQIQTMIDNALKKRESIWY